MPEYFIDFCLEKIFLNSSDTSFEIGEFIKAGSEVFTSDQIGTIEQLMHTLAEGNRRIERIYSTQILIEYSY